jgi:hypothetical protein
LTRLTERGVGGVAGVLEDDSILAAASNLAREFLYCTGKNQLPEAFIIECDHEGGFARDPALANPETEYRESGVVYVCPPWHHDDPGISCAVPVWAARHPHLEAWFRHLEAARPPPRPRKTFGWGAFT